MNNNPIDLLAERLRASAASIPTESSRPNFIQRPLNSTPAPELPQPVVPTDGVPKEVVASLASNPSEPTLSVNSHAPLEGLSELVQALGKSASVVTDNTQAIQTNTSSSQSLGRALATHNPLSSAAGKAGLNLGLSPLVSLIGNLFRRGEDTKPVAAERFELPSSLSWTGGIQRSNGSNPIGISYSQSGLPQPLYPAGASTASEKDTARGVQVVPPSVNPNSTAQITVNVQAMDARSFLDHSTEIATAMRSALLHSHDLNDLLAEQL